MTNSHNKLSNQYKGNNNGGMNLSSTTNTKGKSNSPTVTDRFFNNSSPPFLNTTIGSGRKNRQQRSPSTKYFSSQSSNNVLITPNKYQPQQQRTNSINIGGNKQQHRLSGVMVLGGSPVTNSPPNFSHFASSKCYDAPAPTALPKPPRHWTSCAAEAASENGSKKFDIFSNNLKSILNVQA